MIIIIEVTYLFLLLFKKKYIEISLRCFFLSVKCFLKKENISIPDSIIGPYNAS